MTEFRGGMEAIYTVRIVDFKYSMKHSSKDENNMNVKDPLFTSSLSSRINLHTKAIVLKKGLDKAKRHWLLQI